jgi:hypothetical protein
MQFAAVAVEHKLLQKAVSDATTDSVVPNDYDSAEWNGQCRRLDKNMPLAMAGGPEPSC